MLRVPCSYFFVWGSPFLGVQVLRRALINSLMNYKLIKWILLIENKFIFEVRWRYQSLMTIFYVEYI